MRRRIILAAAGVLAVGGAGAAAFGLSPTSTGTPKRGAQPPKTADITRATLTDFEEVDGELDYGAAVPLRHQGGGVITWLPPLASIVERGKPLIRVDNQPVVLFYGEMPFYRPLTRGVEGPDVRQLEDNLKALGYTGFTPDDEFTASTTTAVKRWQKDLGLAETGVLEPGRVLYAPGAIRVAEHRVRVGDPAGGEVLAYTGAARLVTVALAVSRQRVAVTGATVQIKLPNDKTVAGKVESVGEEVSQQQQNQAATIEVLVSIADQNQLGTLRRAPVKVRFVADERRDVLTVPVSALVALAEGGYGLQLVEGDGIATRYVAVETGLFAGGRVEVRAAGLQAGMKVGVPK